MTIKMWNEENPIYTLILETYELILRIQFTEEKGAQLCATIQYNDITLLNNSLI